MVVVLSHNQDRGESRGSPPPTPSAFAFRLWRDKQGIRITYHGGSFRPSGSPSGSDQVIIMISHQNHPENIHFGALKLPFQAINHRHMALMIPSVHKSLHRLQSYALWQQIQALPSLPVQRIRCRQQYFPSISDLGYCVSFLAISEPIRYAS